MKSGLSKILIILSLGILILLLVVAYVVGRQNMPSLTLISPTIYDQVLKPGPYEVKWEAVGLKEITVAIIDSDKSTTGTVMLISTSGPIDASKGSFVTEIPTPIILVGGVKPRYQFLIGNADLSLRSSPFTVE